MALNAVKIRNRTLLKKFKAEYNKQKGLICFSADWTNPVLWSHYAAKHQGICLGFNVRRTDAQKVTYESERILDELQNKMTSKRINQETKNRLVITKFSHWLYEDEYRILENIQDAAQEGALHFRNFDENLQLAEVILGARCDLSLNAIRQLAKEQQPQAVVFNARLAFKWFKVVPSMRTVPSASNSRKTR